MGELKQITPQEYSQDRKKAIRELTVISEGDNTSPIKTNSALTYANKYIKQTELNNWVK